VASGATTPDLLLPHPIELKSCHKNRAWQVPEVGAGACELSQGFHHVWLGATQEPLLQVEVFQVQASFSAVGKNEILSGDASVAASFQSLSDSFVVCGSSSLDACNAR
jgi:hypothetical protein